MCGLRVVQPGMMGWCDSVTAESALAVPWW